MLSLLHSSWQRPHRSRGLLQNEALPLGCTLFTLTKLG